MRLLLRCISGLERLLEKEVLSILGRGRPFVTERPFSCAVTVSGSLCPRDVYRLHYTSRLVTHIWREIGSVHLNHGFYDDALHSFLENIDYPPSLRGNMVAISIRNSARREDFYAIDDIPRRWADILTRRYDARVQWDDYQVRLLLLADKGGFFRVYAGDGDKSLHIRGLRRKQGVAPMNETLAAAMVSLASAGKWPVIDPFCGCGTIILEYLMRSLKVPAQYFNPAYRAASDGELLAPSEAFQTCTIGNGFDEEEWRRTIKEEDSEIRFNSTDPCIVGFDKDTRMIDFARYNLEPLIGFCGMAQVPLQAFDWTKLSRLYGGAPVTMITNPPFGLRLSRSETLIHSMKEFLHANGSDGVIAVASAEDVKALGCDLNGPDVVRVKVANVNTWLCRVISDPVSVWVLTVAFLEF
ncbi:conserved hypothetical protein [Perkinsus marinus ATCC 50983]|uniref:Ribosomal RNA large subunit methyltransferase K/L-like methyltransferase domain-containing protein n=1 Tax=Perkinsus marinus (strain ATCC 50983 / TXsc) TaxID=423536 RepID=C5KTG7_PERM5|nr:conserved hypothetical protein [Perkinsus marinus ATCC 50983]EER12272.1 conserved hypothetical protein [Perkinsus marinus ATCC 50983]|eukprot:XP_002780477.1 conserved hypothetical protein [Perkinsus marinus ATCC 50983]